MNTVLSLILSYCPIPNASSEIKHTYVRTLWRPNTKATLRLQGCTKPAQLVSMVTYSPFRAQKRIGEWSKGWPASCRTVGAGKKKVVLVGGRGNKVGGERGTRRHARDQRTE